MCHVRNSELIGQCARSIEFCAVNCVKLIVCSLRQIAAVIGRHVSVDLYVNRECQNAADRRGTIGHLDNRTIELIGQALPV